MRPHQHRPARGLKLALRACVSLAVVAAQAAAPAMAATPGANDGNTATPIKHVIYIIGENRSFDHVFGLYKPRAGETISNLLSKGILNADGTPGPNFSRAAQYQASDTGSYANSPQITGPYAKLPPVLTDGAPSKASDTNPPPFATRAAAAKADDGVLSQDIGELTTGATGLPARAIDTRIANAAAPANGPYPLTGNGGTLTYDDYASSPVHRFYQMWQQMDCSIAHATADNPSGCLNDLFPWVEVTVGAGSNGRPQPQGFNDQSTGEGATSMGVYNVNHGDMPYFKYLADTYTLADNYHQAIAGGTGANHIALGTGDAIWYSDGKGNPATPPANQIENPDPQAGTNNFYKQDGYSGGSYSACADASQPGVGAVVDYLASMKVRANCEQAHYYLLNNYNPGYFGDGTVDAKDTYTIPPSSVRNIGDELLAAKISWRYYGEGWNAYVKNPSGGPNPYCNICNPFQYSTSIMTNAAVRQEHIRDTTDLYADLANGTLPAVSIVKPGGLNDGHPASSKFDIFESFVHKIINQLQANPKLWADTAVFITVDEGGGYWDSGYIQPLDFFGDGTRIPLLVVSPFSRGGHVAHAYGDHASFLKFVEANWDLAPITARSRDNLPNPRTRRDNPYVPVNGPAISDLMPMFHFHGGSDHQGDRDR
ncbi:MAG: alkaline phosphatase family protein [Rhodospirillales bacterium]|nr:alkaline phosphatase family protein [Rhodospirillales bacterium]